ncbi:MAG: alpha-galactosidase [Clostridia bacterium]|nr:alpha-galactosidase [Clostridia bacterium]
MNTVHCRIKNAALTVTNEVFSYTFEGVDDFTQTPEENAVILTLTGSTVYRTVRLWRDLPLFEVLAFDGTPAFPLLRPHWRVRSVKLNTLTDVHDTFVTDNTQFLFDPRPLNATGNLFILENDETGECLVFIPLTPDYVTPNLHIEKHLLTLQTDSYGFVAGFFRIGEGERLCRLWQKRVLHTRSLHTMSNTWGDRNCWLRVNEAFIQREIDTAQALGVDVVQIDDGWQKGNTSDCRRNKAGQRIFEGDFWDIHPERFPNGLSPLSAYAKERGVKLGLWFAPDARDDFALLERDITVLTRAYREWGVRYFKLDMLFIHTKKAFDAMQTLLNSLYALGNDVSVELDVTNDKRLGFFVSAPYDTLFMENRYTKWSNAFPHRTLKNLWQLSSFVPPGRLQMEIVNPLLNQDCYLQDDPFAPARYSVDYLFASVMLSCPLFWMEIQFLTPAQQNALKHILSVWKEHRANLADADILPIGLCPSGRAWTGFYAVGKHSYLLLFRECNDQHTFTFSLPDIPDKKPVLLLSNTTAHATLEGQTLICTLDQIRSYAFFELQ